MDACLNTVVRISTEINLLLQSAEGVPGEVSFAAHFTQLIVLLELQAVYLYMEYQSGQIPPMQKHDTLLEFHAYTLC